MQRVKNKEKKKKKIKKKKKEKKKKKKKTWDNQGQAESEIFYNMGQSVLFSNTFSTKDLISIIQSLLHGVSSWK